MNITASRIIYNVAHDLPTYAGVVFSDFHVGTFRRDACRERFKVMK